MINPNDRLEDLLEKCPGLNAFLMERGIVCVLCGEPFWGTLGELIANKKLDVGKVMADVNREFTG